MFNAPSREPQSPHTQKSEKHPETGLIKLFAQLRNALVDPSTSQRAMDGIAGLAIGSVPKLGEFLGQMAEDPEMRSKILESTGHLTGYQGPSLHDRDSLQQKIMQLESQLNNSRPAMSQSMPQGMPQSMPQRSMPQMPPMPQMPEMPQMPQQMQEPSIPMGMSEPTPTMPPTGREGF